MLDAEIHGAQPDFKGAQDTTELADEQVATLLDIGRQVQQSPLFNPDIRAQDPHFNEHAVTREFLAFTPMLAELDRFGFSLQDCGVSEETMQQATQLWTGRLAEVGNFIRFPDTASLMAALRATNPEEYETNLAVAKHELVVAVRDRLFETQKRGWVYQRHVDRLLEIEAVERQEVLDGEARAIALSGIYRAVAEAVPVRTRKA